MQASCISRTVSSAIYADEMPCTMLPGRIFVIPPATKLVFQPIFIAGADLPPNSNAAQKKFQILNCPHSAAEIIHYLLGSGLHICCSILPSLK